MYSGILATHSYLRYIIVLLLVISIVLAIAGLMNKGPYTKKHDKLNLFLFICAHTQLLLGIILYIVSLTNGYRVQFNSSTMKEPALRYFAVEHALAMIIAIVLITVARISTKKTPVDQVKHRRTLTLNLIALLIIIGVVFMMGGKYNTY
jgi:hypothetical protein